MKIECSKEKIQNAISLTERIASKNLTLPVLENILLIAEDNTLTVRATNLDLGVEVVLPVKIEEAGIVAVPGGIINTLLANVQSETISLKVDKNKNLHVTTKKTSTRIKTHPHEDFPILPKVKEEKSFTISIDKFIGGLKSVWYSAAISDIKPEISTVSVVAEGDTVTFAATDSFRLAEKKITLSNITDDFSFLIPFKNISELIRIFDGKEDDIVIYFDDHQIAFKSKGLYVTSRLIDGIFPDYKQILPKEFTSEVIVLKQDLLNAIKITNLFSDKFNKITIDIKPSEKKFEIHSKNSDVGDNKTLIDAALSGDDVTLNFNYKYIIDCFQSIKQDSVSLHLNKESQPMVIKSVGDPSFTYLVMPLNQ